MKENMPKVIALIILITIINCSALVYKGYQSKKDAEIREENRIQKEKNKKEQFAMYIKNEEGSYDKYDGKEFPDGYKVNLEKSSCEDANGNIVSGAISVTNGKPTVTSNKTIYCTFYMDKKPPIAGDIATNPPAETTDGGGAVTGVAQDELEMRYYGKNPANYICFGTTNKTECTSTTGQGKYMYRIIGVTKDKGQGSMFKIIKKTPIEQNSNKVFYWHNVYNQDIKWNQSDLYKGLNGISGGKYSNLFIGNTTYMPSGWSNKIEDVSWKYGDFTNANQAPATILQTEQAWNTTVTAKIGLMYVADYYYGVTKTGLNCYDSANRTTCRNNNWMHFLNNDSSAPNSSYEWTMSRYGRNSDGGYYAWYVNSNGTVGNTYLNYTGSVRPVFYLKSNIEITGTGTQSDPYMIIT